VFFSLKCFSHARLTRNTDARVHVCVSRLKALHERAKAAESKAAEAETHSRLEADLTQRLHESALSLAEAEARLQSYAGRKEKEEKEREKRIREVLHELAVSKQRVCVDGSLHLIRVIYQCSSSPAQLIDR
jgi:hypothetical protein